MFVMETSLKSPFDNVWTFLNGVPQGHEKALKYALYNALALFLMGLCSIAACGLFYILDPFVRPLIWALLIGSVLHPAKRWMVKQFESWLCLIDMSSRSLIVESLLIPMRVIDEVSEIIGSTLKRYIRLLLFGSAILPILYLLFKYTPINLILNIVKNCCYFLTFLLSAFSNSIFACVLLGYISFLSLYWKKELHYYYSLASYGIWLLIAVFCTRTMGFESKSVLVFFLTILVIGFAYEIVYIKENSNKSIWSALKLALIGSYGDCFEHKKEKEISPKPSGSCNVEKPKHANVYFPRKRGNWRGSMKNENESSTYITAVIFCCFLLLLWKCYWLRHFLPLPIAFYGIKHFGLYFGIWKMIDEKFDLLLQSVIKWVKPREAALFPAPLLGLYRISKMFRCLLIKILREYINLFASSLVILALIIFAVLFSTFLSLQIYTEGIHLLAIGANIINSTVMGNPEFLQHLPIDFTNTMESVLENAYIYGREGISKKIRSLMKDVEPTKVEEIEKHLLEFWDRIYQAWLMAAVEKSQIGPKVPMSAVVSSFENIVDTLHRTPDLFNLKVITEFVKDNIDTLWSLLESIYVVLKGNISLVFHLIVALLSLVLGSGSAVLNLLLSSIVFFTALFYLLTSSGDVYKPVDMISNFSPVNGNRMGLAFEAAVNGVFKASFKMALFYGLWTWLIHNLFQVQLVYLPSVLAAILGAVPFLGTYWASIPAILDLWLAQSQGLLAILLFIVQCLPMSFVDTAIYTEIKGGGHPYMTGLAIAGGVFCMGIQGAIFGPLLLCCLLVALNMSSSLLRDSPTDTATQLPQIKTLRRYCHVNEHNLIQLPPSLIISFMLFAVMICTVLGLLFIESTCSALVFTASVYSFLIILMFP